MVKHNRIPKDPRNNYTREIIKKRLDFLSHLIDKPVTAIGAYSIDPQLTRGNIENLTGFVQVPIGLIGPLKINGENAAGDYIIPMATTEGALIASYNRGAAIISLAGGTNVVSLQDNIQRAPYFIFKDIKTAKKFLDWLEQNFPVIKQIAESTTQYGKLHDYRAYLVGNMVFVRLEYTSGDAMGMNMITKATYEVCNYITDNFEIDHYIIESNMAVDKKPAHINMILGRGKGVSADVLINKRIIQRFLGCTPKAIESVHKRGSIGNTIAGVIGGSFHFANGIAAIFLACGQDMANVSESCVGVNQMEVRQGDLYVSIYLPSLVIATVGGGTSLPTQRECLEIIGCYGEGKVNKFTEIIAAALLAGEISLAGSIAAGDFTQAHEKYGRNHPCDEQ